MNAMPLTVAADHPAFAGHFPSQPIVPGVVLLDLGLRAIARHRAGGVAKDGMERCRVANAKFLSPVGPGEPLRLAFEASTANSAAAAASYRLQIFAGLPDHERLALSSDVAFEPLVPGDAH